MYTLSPEDIKVYKTKHPHIAPDLRDGLRCQDKFSDIYSFGRVLLINTVSKGTSNTSTSYNSTGVH